MSQLKKYSSLLFLLIALLTTIFINLSCEDNLVDPGNRNLVWSADTLLHPRDFQTNLRSIWGPSSNNLYLVGHSSSSYGTMWHYDGSGWENVDLFKDIEQSAHSLTEVYGSSPDNIWAVGDRFYNDYNNPGNYILKSLVIKFNGTRWIDQQLDGDDTIQSVWTDSPDNVWAVGFKGLVYHYDGASWNKEILKPEIPPTEEFFLRTFVKHNDQYMMLGTRYINNGAITTFYDFRYTDNQWAAVDSFTISESNYQYNWGGLGFYSVGIYSVGNRLFSYGHGVYEYVGNSWQKILDPPSIMLDMYGNNESNIYAVGYQVVYHYDGSSWQRLTNFDNPNISYEATWTNGDETFIAGITMDTDPQKTIVYKGK